MNGKYQNLYFPLSYKYQTNYFFMLYLKNCEKNIQVILLFDKLFHTFLLLLKI